MNTGSFSKISGTHAACGIVAGAAALVLEKFKDYTPAEVKQHLLNEATNGAVEIPKMFDMLYDTNVNKFLYVGADKSKFAHIDYMQFTTSVN